MLLVPVIGWDSGIGGNDAYTVLLLHCEGADASTTFTDSSASAHTVTAGGAAQIDTAQFKFGSASGLISGAGNYIVTDSSTDFAFGTGDFTLELWIRPSNTAANGTLLGIGTSGASIIRNTSDKVCYYTSGVLITGTTSLGSGTWHHLALARASGQTKLFLDGTQEGSTYTDSQNFGTTATYARIGRYASNGSDSTGNSDEVRISKGIARWTANFTPPTQPYS